MSKTHFVEPSALSRQELFFKALPRTNAPYYLLPDDSLTIVKELDQMDHAFSEKSLHESSFIPAGYDITVMKHPRYTPAISHSHDFIEVVYVLHGCITNFIGTVPLALSHGNICIIGKHTPHALAAYSDDCICYNLLIRSSTFEKVFLGILPENDLLSAFIMKSLYGSYTNSYLYFPAGPDQRIMDCFFNIYEESLQNKPYSRHMLNTLVSTFFITLLRHYSALAISSSPVKQNSANQNISAILYYIQQHYDTITMKKLASLFHYSERHLGRILREYTNCSFKDLIHQLRLRKAAEMLKNTELPVTDIITDIGYTDYGFFYRLFKSEYHLTPAEYRKKYACKRGSSET